MVDTPKYPGGIEYPSLVVIEHDLYPGVSTLEWRPAHEVAHFWWMAVVGNDQINEPWLDDSLTQYGTMLTYEAVYGEQLANAILNAVFHQTYETFKTTEQDLAAGPPSGVLPAWSPFRHRARQRGALLPRTTRASGR